MSMCEHVDFCMQVRAAGGQVFFEPQAVVSYDISIPFENYDRPYFDLRWSDVWTNQTLEHFRNKWRLAEDDPYLARSHTWCARHRQLSNASRIPWSVRIAYARIRQFFVELKHSIQS